MTRKEMIAAMEATVDLAKTHPWWTNKEGCSVSHLVDMLKRMKEDKEMSEAKIGRWLGWAQAITCAYSSNEVHLKYFKELNKGFSKKGKGKK